MTLVLSGQAPLGQYTLSHRRKPSSSRSQPTTPKRNRRSALEAGVHSTVPSGPLAAIPVGHLDFHTAPRSIRIPTDPPEPSPLPRSALPVPTSGTRTRSRRPIFAPALVLHSEAIAATLITNINRRTPCMRAPLECVYDYVHPATSLAFIPSAGTAARLPVPHSTRIYNIGNRLPLLRRLSISAVT